MKPCPECMSEGECDSSCQTGAESYELRMKEAGIEGYELTEELFREAVLDDDERYG